MTLIIEDGSIVANANSYVSGSDIIDYAIARGITIEPAMVEIYAIQAMDYLESKEYIGEEVKPGIQPLKWPRKDVIINRREFPSDAIPTNIIRAQCQLCIYLQQGISLFPSDAGGEFVKREKIGPIETEYSEAVRIAQGDDPIIPLAEAMLEPFLANPSIAMFNVVRR